MNASIRLSPAAATATPNDKDSLERLSQRLCTLSQETEQGLLAGIDWAGRLGPDDWVMSPELTSLYGTPYFEAIREEDLPRYLLLEAVNFFSLNIHGERHLVAGIAQRLHGDLPPAVNDYLHHFLDEENKHMAYFAEFCRRYGGAVFPERGLRLPRDYAPGEELFLFFTKALIFEEVVDHYNARMADDPRLCRTARQINALHHRDESRHRAFGRRLVNTLFDAYAPDWTAETLAGVRAYLAAYLQETWRSFYNPDVYGRMGLNDPLTLRRAVWEHPASRAHRHVVSDGCIRFLCQYGILTEAPAL